MKKIISLMLALIMVLGITAAAESDIDFTNWIQVEIDGVGLTFYRPDTAERDEDLENDGYLYAIAADNMVVAISTTDLEGATLEDYAAAMAEEGYEIDTLELDFDNVYSEYTTEEGNTCAFVSFIGLDGSLCTFYCMATDDAGWETFGAIIGTVVIGAIEEAAA